MKRTPITIITGALLALIFLLVLFAFQVRESQVAVVTRFGKYVGTRESPGLYFRMPYPINKVYKFDSRIHNFERKFETTTTSDAKNLMITVFVGWKIADPQIFLERFNNGDVNLAEQNLENLVRDTKNSVVGRHPFDHFISPDPNQLKFDDIEQEMLDAIKPVAEQKYGIDIALLGIKQLGLPESITTKVFDRMRAERQREVMRFTGEGASEALRIRSEADREREYILAKARAEATEIMGQAEAEAAQYYAVFEQNPDLAIFLFNLKALETSLTNRTTLILDQQTPPFNLFRNTRAETDTISEELTDVTVEKADNGTTGTVGDIEREVEYPAFVTEGMVDEIRAQIMKNLATPQPEASPVIEVAPEGESPEDSSDSNTPTEATEATEATEEETDEPQVKE